VIVFGTDFNLPGSLMPVFILSSAFFNEILWDICISEIKVQININLGQWLDSNI
jgi:hypothetical protein